VNTGERLGEMLRIRRFEEQCILLSKAGQFRGHYHIYIGQEATAVAVCETLTPTDFIFTTWRNHGHLLARGADPRRMMAEILGKAGGYAGGKSGTLHLAVRDLGIPTTSALVGGTLPLATGAALACKQQGSGITVCFFGDAALEEGATYESLLLASLWELPILFVCENNTMPKDKRTRLQAPSSTLPSARLQDIPESLKVGSEVMDGSDADGLRDGMQRLVAGVRSSGKPRFVEVVYTRWPGIVPSWPDLPGGEWQLDWSFGERPGNADIAAWLDADPVTRYVRKCVAAGTLERTQVQAIDARAREEMDRAVRFATESADPSPEQAYRHVFA
jgi:pyruvate dehydrogenase E1 component alpha subunit